MLNDSYTDITSFMINTVYIDLPSNSISSILLILIVFPPFFLLFTVYPMTDVPINAPLLAHSII